jgi:hypothetical protein
VDSTTLWCVRAPLSPSPLQSNSRGKTFASRYEMPASAGRSAPMCGLVRSLLVLDPLLRPDMREVMNLLGEVKLALTALLTGEAAPPPQLPVAAAGSLAGPAGPTKPPMPAPMAAAAAAAAAPSAAPSSRPGSVSAGSAAGSRSMSPSVASADPSSAPPHHPPSAAATTRPAAWPRGGGGGGGLIDMQDPEAEQIPDLLSSRQHQDPFGSAAFDPAVAAAAVASASTPAFEANWGDQPVAWGSQTVDWGDQPAFPSAENLASPTSGSVTSAAGPPAPSSSTAPAPALAPPAPPPAQPPASVTAPQPAAPQGPVPPSSEHISSSRPRPPSISGRVTEMDRAPPVGVPLPQIQPPAESAQAPQAAHLQGGQHEMPSHMLAGLFRGLQNQVQTLEALVSQQQAALKEHNSVICQLRADLDSLNKQMNG